MDFNPIDLILHLDTYLAMLVSNYGVWIYAILFLVIFCETGLVVTPFLPGDSLLFIAGAICATGGMDPWLLGGLLMVAAITGDSTNYVIGRTLGKRLFSNPDSKVFRRDYLDRTHEFYERHGGKTVTLARFLPIVRTFAPFVAGMAKMHYPRFVMFSVFLADKHLTALAGVDLDDFGRLLLAAQAQLPLLHLPELNWYQGFHELVLYPDDFVSPQKHRDASGVVHEFDDERSGETSLQGPVVLAWPGVVGGGGWDAYNLVIHELAHKLDMLNGDANGLPPLHAGMRIGDWASAMQAAYDEMNALLDRDPDAQTAIDPYAAEDPAEFFAVTSEYFFTAPDLLHEAYPAVYRQLQLFYRQDPLQRLRRLQAEHPDYREAAGDTTNG